MYEEIPQPFKGFFGGRNTQITFFSVCHEPTKKILFGKLFYKQETCPIIGCYRIVFELANLDRKFCLDAMLSANVPLFIRTPANLRIICLQGVNANIHPSLSVPDAWRTATRADRDWITRPTTSLGDPSQKKTLCASQGMQSDHGVNKGGGKKDNRRSPFYIIFSKRTSWWFGLWASPGYPASYPFQTVVADGSTQPCAGVFFCVVFLVSF